MHNDPDLAPSQPTFIEALWYWLRLGFISFGGPAGQIAIMHHDLVENKRWISEKRFLHALNFCMVLPGPEAQQLATYIGWLMHRTWGGIIAGVLFVLPSLFILIGLGFVYIKYGNTPVIAGLFYGIKPAVVAIVLFAAYRIGSRALKNPWLWVVTLAAFIGVAIFNVPFPIVVIIAILIGALGGHYLPAIFNPNHAHSASTIHYGKALIDDDTPTPKHALPSKRRVFNIVAVGLFLWGLVMSLLFLRYGWYGTLTQMGWFFTKAALLTFGGAYAVLPYVYQGAVDHYQWLTATQMIDGLALGETTPGPLIMIVAFVGFVVGWTQQLFGSVHPLVAGATAASIVTFFTFLPSFLFVFIGGPLIESTQGKVKFTAPLLAITAAVVGVILSLALFFAGHVFKPEQMYIKHTVAGGIDWLLVVMATVGFVALFKYKLSIIKLILISAVIGYVATQILI